MLEYVAAANAAFGIIKKAIENDKELHTCAKQIATFTHATDNLRAAKDKKKNSIFTKFTGKEDHDLEEFMALEELREKEEELKRMMIYLGRPGLHSDWVRFQVEARKRRQQAEKDRAQKIAKLQEDLLTYFLIFLGIGVGVAVLVLGIMFYQRSS